MLKAIENRELFVVDGLGVRLVGTCHHPPTWNTGGLDGRKIDDRVGVLFLNSLSLPRAASGDSAVFWANALAEQGFPVFRVDLPGLGDSEGEVSIDLLESINDGAFAHVIAAVVEQLIERFELTGMTVFGHCAGSTSAIYAAAAGARCNGLILLDPYFHRAPTTRPKVRQQLSRWARGSKFGMLVSDAYDRARKLQLALRGDALPGNANSLLLSAWQRVAAAGLPILLLQAPGIKAQGRKPRLGEFDFLDYAVKLAGRKSRISVRFVECADHSFANREAREMVNLLIAEWMLKRFPVTQSPSLWRSAVVENNLKKTLETPAERFCVLEGR